MLVVLKGNEVTIGPHYHHTSVIKMCASLLIQEADLIELLISSPLMLRKGFASARRGHDHGRSNTTEETVASLLALRASDS